MRPRGNYHAHRSPGLKPGGSRRGGSHRHGNANRSYYYRPGYWTGYRPWYGLGLSYGYGSRYRGYGYYPYYHYRRYGYRPWVWTTFGGLSAWIGYNSLAPVVYNYSVSDGYIYNDGVQVAPVTVYESQADQIAESVSPPEDAAEWMPVGVFAIVPQGTKDVDVTVQLAVGKNGAIAGTYFNKEGNISLPLQGAIDEAKQRVAWKIGEEDTITMETSLDSLTKDKSTVIIYFSDGVSEIWDMLRVDQETARQAQQELTQDELRNALLSAHQELDQIVNDVWKDYLALPESLSSTGTTPTLSELEPVVKNYQQVQLDSKYHLITDRSEFQKTYQLLQDYLKELKQQNVQEMQKNLPAPPVTAQPVLVAPKP
ncbi:hypothetical protein [Gimesia alba]|uniref:hypothetical protein n=1 Tax=Gimesia alba TaxID=2527973 RepID=UPI0011A06F07|nr:hypothetical protein [Gimesia alba]